MFDHDSDKSDGSRKRPEGEIDVKGIPQDGETFVLTDYKPGAGVYFVFLDDSATADGTDGPKTIIGIPHVRVGIQGANTPEKVAGRITSAINSKSIADPLYDENNPGATQLDLYVKAEQVGAKVKLTMLSDGAARGADAFKPDHQNELSGEGWTRPRANVLSVCEYGLGFECREQGLCGRYGRGYERHEWQRRAGDGSF